MDILEQDERNAEIKRRLAAGEKRRNLARAFGLSKQRISQIACDYVRPGPANAGAAQAGAVNAPLNQFRAAARAFGRRQAALGPGARVLQDQQGKAAAKRLMAAAAGLPDTSPGVSRKAKQDRLAWRALLAAGRAYRDRPGRMELDALLIAAGDYGGAVC